MRDQAEYRQYRPGGEEENKDSAVSSLWEELFSEPLDIRALVEDDNYDTPCQTLKFKVPLLFSGSSTLCPSPESASLTSTASLTTAIPFSPELLTSLHLVQVVDHRDLEVQEDGDCAGVGGEVDEGEGGVGGDDGGGVHQKSHEDLQEGGTLPQRRHTLLTAGQATHLEVGRGHYQRSLSLVYLGQSYGSHVHPLTRHQKLAYLLYHDQS